MNCVKVKYASEKFANDDIERIRKISKRQVIPIRSYLCNNCGTWHITSRESYEDTNKRVQVVIDENTKLQKQNEELLKERNNKESIAIKAEYKSNKLVETLKEENAKLKKTNGELINRLFQLQNVKKA